MLINKENSLEKQNSPECTVREYPFFNTNIGIATTRINGRYPNKGKVLNKSCDIIYYILSGEGMIETEDGKHHIKKGDSILLEKGKLYSVEGKELFACLSSSPAWYFEQYEEIE